MAYYSKPGSVKASVQNGRHLLSTPAGGQVVLDARLKALWDYAPDRSLEEILQTFQPPGETSDVVRAGLACLAEAGLLHRRPATPKADPAPTVPSISPSQISVIIVGFNSLTWLADCLASLAQQTCPPLEIIFVDNASSDGSAAFLQANYPQVKIVAFQPAQSYSQANNQGIAAARGSSFLLLNPDTRLEPEALEQLSAVLTRMPEAAAAAAKLKMMWAPAFLNGLGNYVGPLSFGVDLGLGHLDLGQFDAWEEVPSACFAAALIRRSAWEETGPLDEGFPMYYEDSEWCYRARTLGYTIAAAPQAVVYHAFGSASPAQGNPGLSPAKLHNNLYGRLRFAAKLSGRAWARFLSLYLLEDSLRLLLYGVRGRTAHVRAGWSAWQKFRADFRAILAAGQTLQARAQAKGAAPALFELQKQAPPPFIWQGFPELTWDQVSQNYLPLFISGKTRPMPEFPAAAHTPRLLIISNDIVDHKMAGPGLRYYELARTLARHLPVTLAAPDKTSLQGDGFPIAVYQPTHPASLQKLAGEHEIVLISSFLLNKFPFLESSSSRLVVDMYDPFIFENLYYFSQEPLPVQSDLNQQAVDTLNRLAQVGDFFICGSERQRDFWIGLLAANGRINPHTFAQDSSLQRLIDVVSVGIPETPPQPVPVLKNTHPAFPPGSQIVLWGGGIWNWLDPLTLIQAWPVVANRFPLARLVFLGTRHPNPLVPTHAIAAEAEKLAAELGEKDRSIFFFEWVSIEERAGLLCEADVGVTLHPAHAETRYSIRTRILDYFWAGLPVLVTAGDVTSEWVQQYQVGEVISGSDPNAAAQALCRLLSQPKEHFQPRFEQLRADFHWSRVVQPLQAYCLSGEYAPDRKERRPPSKTIRTTRRGKMARAWYIVKQQGLQVFMHRVWKYLQWRLSQSL
jgi:GT2 family glycosyltransferase/glycosyltransferase involved in cell wall biosynthesis